MVSSIFLFLLFYFCSLYSFNKARHASRSSSGIFNASIAASSVHPIVSIKLRINPMRAFCSPSALPAANFSSHRTRNASFQFHSVSNIFCTSAPFFSKYSFIIFCSIQTCKASRMDSSTVLCCKKSFLVIILVYHNQENTVILKLFRVKDCVIGCPIFAHPSVALDNR